MFSLCSKWTIKRGEEEETGIAALADLAREVQEQEEGTLVYLVHVPDMTQPSLPTPSGLEVVFFEVYRDEQAFADHVNGAIFQQFVARYKDLFLPVTVTTQDGEKVTGPLMLVEFLERKAGFIRPEALITSS